MFDMKQKHAFSLLAAMLVVSASCTSHYHLTNVERSRILIDKTYDTSPDTRAQAFITPYEHKVDSLMSPVVGHVDHYMAASRPESDLSNLLADILVWASDKFGEHPDFAVYNMGGIRAAFAKGKVTYGDVLDVAPFENKICFLTLSGADVLDLFRQMASVGGEGVSHSVRLVITKDRQLKSAEVNGQPIDAAKSYRVATLDYLAQGNDKLVAFTKKTHVVSPQNEENNVRFIIMDYFRDHEARHEAVTAKVEGRIKVE